MVLGLSSPPRRRVAGVLRGLFRSASCAALVALAACGGNGDARPQQWSVIYPAIIEPSCATASCHSDITRRVGVNLADKTTAIVNLEQRRYVIQGNSTDSALMYLLRGQGARRMPPDFALPEIDIKLIQDWIDLGGKND
jgi:hypothetical protein